MHRVELVSSMRIDDPAVQQRLAAMQQMLISKGMAPNVALETSYKMLEGSVMQQSTLLSYMDVFIDIGIMFLVCVPFVLIFVKGGRQKTKLSEAALH